jgi:hypothetical protein
MRPSPEWLLTLADSAKAATSRTKGDQQDENHIRQRSQEWLSPILPNGE